MSKRQPNIPEIIDRLFVTHKYVTTGDVARAAGVTRQAARYHLKAMEGRGQVLHTGVGRAGRYQRATQSERTYPLAGLQEDSVWTEEWAALKQFDLPIFDNPKVQQVLVYGFTEMLNNAIDHSEGTSATVRWFTEPNLIAFEIEDDGVGVFQKVCQARHLDSDFDSIGELSKGKQTTDPTRHSGLGIFFTSRLANRFILSSGQLTWTRDNDRDDEAVGWLDDERMGTVVRCEVFGDTDVNQVEVFNSFSHPEEYNIAKTRVRVALFGQGNFVSRSEAKRIGANLEEFDRVELDFAGIHQVGQGFIDELFRVWQNAHPTTELVPVNANPAITALIKLATSNN